MIECKHAPGPWTPSILSGPSTHIGWTPDNQENPPRVVLIAHAEFERFIAQRDELLAALKDLQGFADHVFGDYEWAKGHGVMIKARAALAKLRGNA